MQVVQSIQTAGNVVSRIADRQASIAFLIKDSLQMADQLLERAASTPVLDAMSIKDFGAMVSDLWKTNPDLATALGQLEFLQEAPLVQRISKVAGPQSLQWSQWDWKRWLVGQNPMSNAIEQQGQWRINVFGLHPKKAIKELAERLSNYNFEVTHEYTQPFSDQIYYAVSELQRIVPTLKPSDMRLLSDAKNLFMSF